jgi:hypothetical protein
MLIVVGGHSRNIGKTSVVCNIIRELADWDWTALKVTQYGHGVCSHAGQACECADPAHPVAISEQGGSGNHSDTERFLRAGAHRSFWARTRAGELAEAMPRIRRILAESGNVIMESNSILQFLQPNAYLMVTDASVQDFKDSSRRYLDRADALIVTSDAPLKWRGVGARLYAKKPLFRAPGPSYQSPELIAFLRGREPIT